MAASSATPKAPGPFRKDANPAAEAGEPREHQTDTHECAEGDTEPASRSKYSHQTARQNEQSVGETGLAEQGILHGTLLYELVGWTFLSDDCATGRNAHPTKPRFSSASDRLQMVHRERSRPGFRREPVDVKSGLCEPPSETSQQGRRTAIHGLNPRF